MVWDGWMGGCGHGRLRPGRVCTITHTLTSFDALSAKGASPAAVPLPIFLSQATVG